ncbi:MAG: hypothetical protein R2799_00190 [Crocinitomicaceae bacterium]
MKYLIVLGLLSSCFSCSENCKNCFVIQNSGTISADTVFVEERCGNASIDEFLNMNWTDITGNPIPAFCN